MVARSSLRLWTVWGVLLMALVLGACKKKEVPPPPTPPPPPAPAAPTATLRAEPSVIEQGQSSTLSWNSTNATELRIDPDIGTVSPQGSTTVRPERSTTYTVLATGPGGRAEASARITVNIPPPPPPPAEPPIEELFARNIQDAFFDFDKYDIRPDARETLTRDAEFLRRYLAVRVLIEGHCDERGTNEYNIGLGEHRAQAAKQFLVSLGISPDRIQTITYGEERPFCRESNETCWQQNRRAHFVLLK